MAEIQSENTKVLIELKQDGSFPIEENKQRTTIKLTMDSRNLLKYTPILLLSISSTNLHHKAFKHSGEVQKQFLEENYTIFNGSINEYGTWSEEVTFTKTGSVFFQMIFVESFAVESVVKIAKFGVPEWINIDPQLRYKGKDISYQQIAMQSLVSKCMGDYSRWKEILKGEAELGYNAFHFTPIQDLGYSGSNYCIKDQLTENCYENLKSILDYAHNELDCLSFVDLVLNHTSSNSPWLKDDPESYYSPANTPSLTCAMLMDTSIQKLSNEIINGTSSYSNGIRIESEVNIKEVLNILKEEYLDKLNLETYFLMNEEKITQRVRTELKRKYPNLAIKEQNPSDSEWMSSIFEKEKDEEISELIKNNIKLLGASSYGVEFEYDVILEYYQKNSKLATFQHLSQAIKQINKDWLAKSLGFIEQAMTSLFNDIKYRKLELGNHELVFDSNPLTYPYFTKIRDNEYAANNGWIFGGNALENFAISGNFHYFRRTIVVWGDLVKLRFGNSPNDCPKLWGRMSAYAEKMAEHFQGFRIDNAHSTPIWVAEGLVKLSREKNPNLHVFLELFTNSDKTDAKFFKRVGANALVREFQRARDHQSVYTSLQIYGDVQRKTVGSIKSLEFKGEENLLNIECVAPISLLYDITHDNEHYSKVTSTSDQLPRIAQLAFGNVFTGSTKGYDELYSINPSVVNENRKYCLPSKDGFEFEEINKQKTLTKISYLFYGVYTKETEIFVHGTWNDWWKGVPMVQNKDFGNIFQCEIELDEGVYEYKFKVNGDWLTDSRKHINSNTNHILKVISDVSYQYTSLKPVRKEFLELMNLVGHHYKEIYIEGRNYDCTTIMRQSEDKKSYLFLVSRNAFQTSSSEVSVSIELPSALKSVKAIYHMNEELQDKDNSEELVGRRGNIIKSESLNNYADIYQQY